jgi:hypothetical protein
VRLVSWLARILVTGTRVSVVLQEKVKQTHIVPLHQTCQVIKSSSSRHKLSIEVGSVAFQLIYSAAIKISDRYIASIKISLVKSAPKYVDADDTSPQREP